MLQDNNITVGTRRLTAEDISGPLGSREQVRPDTGLTGDSKSTRRLTAQEISEGFMSDVGGAAPFISPGSIGKYEKILGEGQYHPELGPTYTQQLLHENQTATGMFGNMLMQFGAQVVGTAIQTIGYDLDLGAGIRLSMDTEAEFGNAMSRAGETVQDKIREAFPIYVDPYKKGNFDPGSWSWWMSNAPSVGSTLGMVAPAMLFAAATGGIGAAAGLGSMVKTAAFRGVTTALWSRHAENLMEASGVYKQVYQESKTKGLSEEESKKLASLGASNTYKKQWALLVQDIPQYILFNKLGALKAGGKVAEKEVLKGLAPAVEKYLGYGVLATKARKVGAVAMDMAGEGGEELYQALVNEQSNLMAANAADPNHNVKHSMMDALKNQYDQGDFWTAGFWGAAGAGVMHATMAGMNYKLQEAASKAQIDVVSNFGTILKQASTEYGAALDSGDPIKADQALPSLISAVAMKAKLTNTTGALKKMLNEMKDAPEGTSFEKWGVDPATQGRLKQDPAFFDQIDKGIDRVHELYDRYLIENTKNTKIKTSDKEGYAQVMANSQFLLEFTEKNKAKTQTARDNVWAKIENVNKLSEPGQTVLGLKYQKTVLENRLKYYEDRQEKTKDTASELEKKQIDVVVENIKLQLAKIDTSIVDQTKLRTKAQEKADAKILPTVPEDQVNEFMKQSSRVNDADDSITQLTTRLEQLRAGTPLGEIQSQELKKQLGLDKTDIEGEPTIQVDDVVEFKDPETGVNIIGRVDGIELAEEGVENAVDTYVIQPLDKDGKAIGEPVIKSAVDLYISEKKDDNIEDEIAPDELKDSEQKRLGTTDEWVEGIEVNPMHPISNLSYTNKDNNGNVVSRNSELSKVLKNKKTVYAGATSWYSINFDDPSTLTRLRELKNGVKRADGTWAIAPVSEKQGVLIQELLDNKELKATKKQTREEKVDALLEGLTGTSFMDVVDRLPISVRLKIEGKSYESGLYLHDSNFPYIYVPSSERKKGNTREEQDLIVTKYRAKMMAQTRKNRRELLKLILLGEKIYTTGIDVSRGVPNTVDKSLTPDKRNRKLTEILKGPVKKIKIAVSKSSSAAPKNAVLYDNKNEKTKVNGRQKEVVNSGNVYTILKGETIDNSDYPLKLNRPYISQEHAEILFDAFVLVGRARVSDKRTVKPVHSYLVQFRKEDIGRVTGLSAGETIDLLVQNGRSMTEPEDARFKKRYPNKEEALVRADKRLYLAMSGKNVVLVYGNDPKTNRGKTIDLNNNSDINAKKQDFLDWITTTKRYAIYVYSKKLNLSLDGDFLNERTFTIGREHRISRKRNETYSEFIINNGLVETDVERDEDGSLFHDPVINLNITTPLGQVVVNVVGKKEQVSKRRVVTKAKEPSVYDSKGSAPIDEDTIGDKSALNSTKTKVEKESDRLKALVPEPKEPVYKNRFSTKKDRTVYEDGIDLDTHPFTSSTDEIKVIDRWIEESITSKKTVDEVVSEVKNNLIQQKIKVGSRGAVANKSIFEYIKDRFDGKTQRTLLQEWEYGQTNLDKTSSTKEISPLEDNNVIEDVIGFDVEPKVGPGFLSLDGLVDDTGEPTPGALSEEDFEKLMNDVNDIPNNKNNKTGIAKEVSQKSYTIADIHKDIQWAYDVVGIAKEDWDIKTRLVDLIYQGRENFALYSQSAITLYELAETGTVYHEAFHRVSLAYLTKGERAQLYRAARTIYSMSVDQFTDKQVEEHLASKFESFMLSKGVKKQVNAIQKFFNWISEGIKKIFYGNRRLTENEVEQLFGQIREGEFRNNKLLKENRYLLESGEYRKAIIRDTLFNTLNTRKEFKDLVKTLVTKLLNLNNVADLNEVSSIKHGPLVSYLEDRIGRFDGVSKNVNNSEEIRASAIYVRDLFKEVLGEKDEVTNRYRNYSTVFKPAMDMFLLNMGVIQVGVTEEDLDSTNEDLEAIGRLGGDYLVATYERNKKDTALPSIKFAVATLHETSKVASDGIRTFVVSPVTRLATFVDFPSTWSKLFNDLYHIDNVTDMIEQLKVLAEERGYSPYAELAEKLENESEMFRIQFFVTLRSAKYDFIGFRFYQTQNSGVRIKVERSAVKDAVNGNVSKWNESFFNDDRITRTEITKIEGEKSGLYHYHTYFRKEFFNRVEEDFLKLEQRVSKAADDVANLKESERVVFVEKNRDLFIKELLVMLNDFSIITDEEVLLHLIRKISGESINNDLDRLSSYVSSELPAVFSDSKAFYAANEGKEVDRSSTSFWGNAVIQNISRADIEVHPEKMTDIQLGPERHKYNTFANPCQATEVINRLKNEENYAIDRLHLVGNKHSRILNSLVPLNYTIEEIEKVLSNRAKLNLMTFSYLQEENTGDEGRGYLNITEIEDYLIKYSSIYNRTVDEKDSPLLPLPVLASRKTYFFLNGVNVFKKTAKSIRGGYISFSDEVLEYFYGQFLDENERVLEAKALLKSYETAKTEEEKNVIKNRFRLNYHYADNFDFTKGNAYDFIRFRGFTSELAESKNKKQAIAKISSTLNKVVQGEVKYAAALGVINFVEGRGYSNSLLDYRHFSAYETEFDNNEDKGIRGAISDFALNTMMSILECEKLFLGDPAFFARNEESKEIEEDLYKRWFGVGSSGEVYAETLEDDSTTFYNSLVLNTQKFKAPFYDALHDKYVKLWTEYFTERNKDSKGNDILTESQIVNKAELLSKERLRSYTKVDPTDGQAWISPTMYKSMLRRSGAWTPKVQRAFELLNSDKKLSPDEELEMMNVVLNPQKTVYIGSQEDNGLDTIIYDKMSMAILFKRVVEGTHLEEVLDRMELAGKFADIEGLEKIHVINFNSAVKVGGRRGYNLFRDGKLRNEINDLTNVFIMKQYWRNLRKQQVTDPRDNYIKQLVGSQVFKIGSSNIRKDKPYGKYATGMELLNALTRSRVAISNTGVYKVEAELGIRNGKISNANLISLLKKSAVKANKADDFIRAIKQEENGKMYLELDAFPDRDWIYSRIMNLISSNTVELNLQGSHLIQSSDYGFSDKEFSKELAFSILNEDSEVSIDMECKVSIRVFQALIPNYNNLTHEQRVKALSGEEMVLLGYRIPTQGQNSVVNLKVVEFLPDEAGDIIHLPLEFTALTGSDFDIDPLYVIRYNYIRANGKLRKVEFNEDLSAQATTERYHDKVEELYRIFRRDLTVFDLKTKEALRKLGDSPYLDEDVERINSQNTADYNSYRNHYKDLQRWLDSATSEEAKNAIVFEMSQLDTMMDDIRGYVVVKEEVKKKTFNLKLQTLLKYNKILSYEDFTNQTIEEQNSSEANENRIIDIFRDVIRDKKHYTSATQPLGALTDVLKAEAAKNRRAESGGKLRRLGALESLTPSYQSSTRFKFISSTKGIGPFALANAHHSLTQMAALKMRTKIEYEGVHNGVVDLDLIEGRDNVYITDWLSAMIDAHVDAVKDNYIADLNVNNSTYGVAALMLRLGYGLSTFKFLSQPILKEFAKEYFNKSGRINDTVEEDGTLMDKAYETIRLKYLSKLGVEDVEGFDLYMAEKDISLFDLLKDEKSLDSDLNPKTASDDERNFRQLNILEHFFRIDKDAKALTKLVLISRVDTKDYGTKPTEVKYFLNKLMEIEGEEGKDKFPGLSRLINSDGEYVENGTMLSPLLNNSVLYLTKLLQDKSIYGTIGFDDIFWRILFSIPSSVNFRISGINNLSEELFGYFVGQFFGDPQYGVGMTKERLEKLLFYGRDSVFGVLDNLKRRNHKHYEELSKNKFLNLVKTDSKKDLPIEAFLRIPFKAKSDKWENDDYIEDFLALATHEDPEVRKVARMLYLYCFYSTGFRHRFYSYMSYIPTSLNKSIELTNSKTKKQNNVSFNDYVVKMLKDLNDPAIFTQHFESAKREVLTNNWFNRYLVPNIDKEEVVEHRSVDGLVRAVELVIEKNSKYALGKNKEEDVIFAQFVTFSKSATYNVPTVEKENPMATMPGDQELLEEEDKKIGADIGLFELIGINEETGNPVYMPINKKGYNARAVVSKEYGIPGNISVTPQNNLIDPWTIEKTIGFLPSPSRKESAMKWFKYIPFNQQQVTDRAAVQTEDFAVNMAVDRMEEEKRINKEKEANIPYELFRLETIITGVQSGIDEDAIKIAKKNGFRTGGRTTPTWKQEGGVGNQELSVAHNVSAISPNEMAELREDVKNDRDYSTRYLAYEGLLSRTYWNVKNSDATVYFAANVEKSRGLGADRKAVNKYHKHLFVYISKEDLDNGLDYGETGTVFSTVEELRYLMKKYSVQTLNIAGNRASLMTSEQKEFFHNFLEEFLTKENVATEEKIVEVKAVKADVKSHPQAMSSYIKPIDVFVDGSDTHDTGGTYGYGVWSRIAGEEYAISGTATDVDNQIFKYFPEVKDQKRFNGTVELLGLIASLEQFQGTAEHLRIYVDNDGGISYLGLYERALYNVTKPDPFRKDAPWRAKQPHIIHLVKRVLGLIENIEKNGGTVRINYVPGHVRGDKARIEDYVGRYKENNVFFSKTYMEGLMAGNEKADKYAEYDKPVNNFSKITKYLRVVSKGGLLEFKDLSFDVSKKEKDEGKETKDNCTTP